MKKSVFPALLLGLAGYGLSSCNPPTTLTTDTLVTDILTKQDTAGSNLQPILIQRLQQDLKAPQKDSVKPQSDALLINDQWLLSPWRWTNPQCQSKNCRWSIEERKTPEGSSRYFYQFFHDNQVSWLFIDGIHRYLPLPELWTLSLNVEQHQWLLQNNEKNIIYKLSAEQSINYTPSCTLRVIYDKENNAKEPYDIGISVESSGLHIQALITCKTKQSD